MATSFSPDALRGLMVPDPRIDTGSPAGSSSYTQADPQPGIPSPNKASSLTLSTTGTQVNGATVEVSTTRAGGAVTTDSVRAGAFAWREAGGAWQGWDGPLGYAGFEAVHTWQTGAGAQLYGIPHVVYSSVGTRLVSAQRTTAIGVLQELVVLRRTQAGATSTVVVATNAAAGQPLHSTLVSLPEGRLLLLAVYDDLPSAGAQVRAWASTDDGVSWQLQTDACLPSPIPTATVTTKRLRAAYYGGQVLMVLAVRVPAAAVPDTLWQYASIDHGMSFTLVEAVAGTDPNSVHTGGVHDVVAMPDVGFVVVYCGSSRATWGANSSTLSKRCGSAFSRWTDIDPDPLGLPAPGTLSVGNQLSADTELCAAVDDDGQVYALSSAATDVSRVRPARTTDGVSWSLPGTGLPAGERAASTDFNGERPDSMVCAWYAGALHLVHSVDSTTIYDSQLGDTVLSGYTAAPMPMLPGVQSGGDYSAGSYTTWEPWWLPTTIGYTATTVGAPTATLTGGALLIAAGLAEVLTYRHAATVALTVPNTVQATWEVDCDANTNTHATLESSNGTNTYRLRVRVTTTQVLVIDFVSGATLVTYGRTAAEYVHVRAWMTNSGGSARATVWVDEVDGPHGIARGYVRVASNLVLTDAGVTAAAQSVTFGQTGQGQSSWRYLTAQYSSSMSSPHALVIPDDLWSRDWSTRPLTLSQGLGLRAVGGPSALADSWKIPARYAHPVTSLGGTSPSVTWRSSGTASPQVFVWETSSTVASTSPLMGPLGALYLGGVNFRTALLEGRTALGVWVTIGTWDASSGQAGLAYDRRGDIVTPSTGTPSAGVYWYPHSTLDGARFTFDAAAGPVRAVRYQTEGAWTSAQTKRARLQLYGDMTGVPASGAAGALLATGGLLVWNTDAVYSAYRLTIPVQPVAEAYYEAGVARLGHLAVFGRRYSWGRNLESVTNTSLSTGRNGRRTSSVDGPTRRAVELGWTDAADQSAFSVDQTTAQPDYFLGSSTGAPEPAAARNDGPMLMRGLVEHLQGSHTPVVYVAHLPRAASGTTSMIVHPDLHLWSRIVSDVSVETVQGTEWSGVGATGEMVRTSSVRLEEEL